MNPFKVFSRPVDVVIWRKKDINKDGRCFDGCDFMYIPLIRGENLRLGVWGDYGGFLLYDGVVGGRWEGCEGGY